MYGSKYLKNPIKTNYACSITGREGELECLYKTVENIKKLFEIKYQYLKDIQVEQVNLKWELKNYKVLSSKLHKQMNWIDQLSMSQIFHTINL